MSAIKKIKQTYGCYFVGKMQIHVATQGDQQITHQNRMTRGVTTLMDAHMLTIQAGCFYFKSR